MLRISDRLRRGVRAAAAQQVSAGNVIARFARHGTAANLLMLTLILIGLFSLTRLNRQFFPDFDVPIVRVSVAWPGASAEDVEKGILDVLEPAGELKMDSRGGRETHVGRSIAAARAGAVSASTTSAAAQGG